MIAKVRAASGLYTDKEAKQGRARPDRSSQAAVYWTILAIEGKTSPAKGRRASMHMGAVEGTGSAQLPATNEPTLKQVLLNSDQFSYFFRCVLEGVSSLSERKLSLI